MDYRKEIREAIAALHTATGVTVNPKLDSDLGEAIVADICRKAVKNCNTPAVSVEREPVALGAVCPHFETCYNGGKNKYCDLHTWRELDCFVGQTER